MTTMTEWAQSIGQRDHGLLRPHALVDDARDPSSPGHSYFEWDDAIAGEAHRIEQARKLIRSIRIEYRPTPRSEPRSVRAYWHDRSETVGYRRTEEIASDPIGKEVMLAEMAREWRTFKRRYEHMAEFVDLVLGDLADKAA